MKRRIMAAHLTHIASRSQGWVCDPCHLYRRSPGSKGIIVRDLLGFIEFGQSTGVEAGNSIHAKDSRN